MIVGIDLGTTNSLIAYFDGDHAKVIPNRLGENLTPSVVSVDEEGIVYVGKTAKERKMLYPDQTADVFKRNMGSSKVFTLGTRKFSAEELSSLVLKKMKSIILAARLRRQSSAYRHILTMHSEKQQRKQENLPDLW
mgnify:CR=1 FL=1